ncbi:Voltage-dependent calcium channel gamma-3 subunit [Bagarius yarrelli]|uniref:Voltage-dependent calcium channel gamma-3 subunit n=1 Tax=Bagarius yarrelli TaxID=175774 RepID=A0A556TVQ7_BAGYA|nr:Voltage-dependent calcium channel gamma-3 subunit [Bagarius yarrelli]
MLLCDRGVQMLITTVGAFAAFSLMTIAVGTDYWLYSRGVCKTKVNHENETSRKNEEVMTHSGLWRTCCLEGDPGQSDSKKSYSYGWSFYFGALSFIMAETVGVLAVHMFIEKHRKQQRAKTLVKKSSLGFGRIPTYRYRFGRRSSETPSRDVPMFTLSRDSDKAAAGKLLDSDRDFFHNSNTKDAANRRTTPV